MYTYWGTNLIVLAHNILVLIAHAQMPPLTAHADVSHGAPSLHLHPANCLYASSESSDEAVHLRTLA